jgi:hypothetical protein
VRSHGSAGLRLLAAGLAVEALYAVAIWYAVFENDTAAQDCGSGVAHRDNFFPPYTTCGSGAQGHRITSAMEEYAGAALFVIGAVLLLTGAVLVIAGRVRAPSGRPREMVRR